MRHGLPVTDIGAPGEFDLASPRWRERPQAVLELAARLAQGAGPLERHRLHGQQVDQTIQRLRSALAPRDRSELDRRIDVARRYLAFREDGKDVLMLGYDLLRDLARQAGRRLEIDEDVFYLTREDLFDALRVGFAPIHLIETRKRVHRAQAKAALPRVIDATAIDTLGQSLTVPSQHSMKGFGVSPGNAAGPARILLTPTDAGDLGRGYILVCPSTDPSWTPLFVNAAGLVLECGGMLSHGAVVARELGLPAIILPDATRLLGEGEDIGVDGRTGVISRQSKAGTHHPPGDQIDPQDTRVTANRVPPPGSKDRNSAKIRNIFLAVWLVYLAAAFGLPSRWLYLPSLHFLDRLLWPVARHLGKPAVVTIVATGLAVLTLILQKFLTDNRRLLEAKRRSALLNREADALPKDSRRRAALLNMAAPFNGACWRRPWCRSPSFWGQW